MVFPIRGGFEYFTLFTDDHFRYGYIYLMHHKFKAFEKFRQFKYETKKQLGKTIKALRLDRGGKYLLGEFLDFLKDNGILTQLILPVTPQLNGVVGRRNRILLDIIRSMLSYSSLRI